MHVLTIDGRQFSDGKAVHRMLKKLLCLPDYYGGNADALYDALDERSERIDLRLLSLGGEDTAKTLRKVARVVQDLGGTYMIQAESDHLGCVCPDCGYRCNDCLGTNTVVGRESLKALAFDPRFDPDTIFREAFLNQEEDEEE